MKALSIAAVLFAVIVAVEAWAECSGDCPDGYMSICVEIGDDCRCSCVEEEDAKSSVRELLDESDVSYRGVRIGAGLFNEKFDAGERNFVVEFKDVGGKVFIHASLEDDTAH